VLERIEPGDAVPALAGRLGDADSGARRMAASLLGRLGPKAAEAIPELERLAADDPDADVREAAGGALEKMREEPAESDPEP